MQSLVGFCVVIKKKFMDFNAGEEAYCIKRGENSYFLVDLHGSRGYSVDIEECKEFIKTIKVNGKIVIESKALEAYSAFRKNLYATKGW